MVFSLAEVLFMIERARKNAEIPAFNSNNGAPNPNIYEPLCEAIDYAILNPNWRPTYILVDSVNNFLPSDYIY